MQSKAMPSGPGEVLAAVKDVFTAEADPPPIHSTPGTSAFPLPSDPHSSLVFHPPVQRQSTPLSPTHELSPGAVDSSTTRLPTPLEIPTTASATPRPTSDAPQSGSSTFQPFRNKAFSALRRGSLMPTSSTLPLVNVNGRRGSDPNTDMGRVATPRFTMSVTEAAAAHGHGAGSLRGKDREVMQTTSVAFKDGNLMSRHKPKLDQDDTLMKKPKSERGHEDFAMAKWRKWIIEQPVIPPTSDISPVRSRKGSPAQSPQTIPMVPLASQSPLAPSITSSSTNIHSPRSPLSPLAIPKPPSRNNSDESRSTGSALSPFTASRTGRFEPGPFEIFATDTVRALQDVELAVDESMLSRTTQKAQSQPRRMSTNPRISEDAENPFIDLGSRLSSRRVRPLVIELIQALGHYIDAVWCTTYPQQRCPWIMSSPANLDRRPSAIHAGSGSGSGSLTEHSWKSNMITAVQEGKRLGYVSDPPTSKDVNFWEEEVRHALRDVDDVVGIYKGVCWAFNTAMVTGRYGEVDKGNALGKDGEGGNYARLLNDLEEAMWGDAAPRPTDLAYDLPLDFDPYAVPDPAELGQSSQGGGSLAAFFSDTNGTAHPPAMHTSPVPEEIYNIALPELSTDTQDDANSEGSGPLSPLEATSRNAQTRGSGGADALNLDAFRIDGQELSLEEIGKRRHQEWLQSRRAEGSSW